MESTAEAVMPDKAGDTSAQDRSSIKFPYLDQDDSLEIAKKVFEIGGKSCDKVALAAAFNVSADGGGFGLRLATAKMFGFIGTEKKTITLTELGQRAVDPATEKAARAESFLEVPLYEKLYEDYQGQLLPGIDGLEAHIVKLGVAPKQKDKARQVFLRTAKQAGYFSISSNRLAAPQFKQGSVETTPLAPEKPDGGNGGSGGTGSGGNDGKKRHPFIEGLLETLPPAALGAGKTEWGLKERQDWLQTAAGIFNLIYTAKADDKGAVTVSVAVPKESSAN
jgi:hypothetical protein